MVVDNLRRQMPNARGASLQPTRRRSSAAAPVASLARKGIHHSANTRDKPQKHMRMNRSHDSAVSASSSALVSVGPYAYIVRQPPASQLRCTTSQNRSRSSPPEPIKEESSATAQRNHTRSGSRVRSENDNHMQGDGTPLWISPVKFQRDEKKTGPEPMHSFPKPYGRPFSSFYSTPSYVTAAPAAPVVAHNPKPHVCETGAAYSTLASCVSPCVGTKSALPASFVSVLSNRMQQKKVMREGTERITRERVGVNAPQPSGGGGSVEKVHPFYECVIEPSAKGKSDRSQQRQSPAFVYTNTGQTHNDNATTRLEARCRRDEVPRYNDINTEVEDEVYTVNSNKSDVGRKASPAAHEMDSLNSLKTTEWAGRLWDGIAVDEARMSRWLAERGLCPNDDVLSLRIFVDYLKNKSGRLEKEVEELFWSNRYQGEGPKGVPGAYQTVAGGQRHDGYQVPHPVSYPYAHSHTHPYADKELNEAQRGYSQNRSIHGSAHARNQSTPMHYSYSYQNPHHSEREQQRGKYYQGMSRERLTRGKEEDPTTDYTKSPQKPLGRSSYSNTRQKKSVVSDVSQFYTGRSLAAESRAKDKNAYTTNKKSHHHNVNKVCRTCHTSFSSSSSSSSSIPSRPRTMPNTNEFMFNTQNALLDHGKHHHHHRHHGHSPMGLPPRPKHQSHQREQQSKQDRNRACSPLPGKHTKELPGVLIHPIYVPDMSDVSSDADVQRLRHYCTDLEVERGQLINQSVNGSTRSMNSTELLVARNDEPHEFLSGQSRFDRTMLQSDETTSLSSVSSPSSSEKANVKDTSLENKREDQKAPHTPPQAYARRSSARSFGSAPRLTSPAFDSYAIRSPDALTATSPSRSVVPSIRYVSPLPAETRSAMNGAADLMLAARPRATSPLASADHSVVSPNHSPRAAASTAASMPKRDIHIWPESVLTSKAEMEPIPHSYNRDYQDNPKPNPREGWHIERSRGTDAHKELRQANTSGSSACGAASSCLPSNELVKKEVARPFPEPMCRQRFGLLSDRGESPTMRAVDCVTPNEYISPFRSPRSGSELSAQILPNSTQDSLCLPKEKKLSSPLNESPYSRSSRAAVTWSGGSSEEEEEEGKEVMKCRANRQLTKHRSIPTRSQPDRREEQCPRRTANRFSVPVLDQSVHALATPVRSSSRDENDKMSFSRNAATLMSPSDRQCQYPRDGVVIVNRRSSVMSTPNSETGGFFVNVIAPVNTSVKSNDHGNNGVYREKSCRSRRFGLR